MLVANSVLAEQRDGRGLTVVAILTAGFIGATVCFLVPSSAADGLRMSELDAIERVARKGGSVIGKLLEGRERPKRRIAVDPGSARQRDRDVEVPENRRVGSG